MNFWLQSLIIIPAPIERFNRESSEQLVLDDARTALLLSNCTQT